MSRSIDIDKVFYPEDGTEPPDIKACVIHPWVEATKTLVSGPTMKFAGVRYGLCAACEELKEKDPAWDNFIDFTIQERLTELMKRGGDYNEH